MSNKFNAFFEKHKYHNNPFAKGYGEEMAQSLNYQEDTDVVKNANCKVRKRELVMYREPDPILPATLEAYAQLGDQSVDDFSFSMGTDYNIAHNEQATLVDTVKRYTNLDDITNSRATSNFEMSRDEMAYRQQQQQDLAKLEQLRISKVREEDEYIQHKYVHMNRRIGFK